MRPLARLIAAANGLAFCTLALAAGAETANPPLAPKPFPVSVDPTQDEFCLIMVPDTQRYAAYFPHIFHAQFRWIRDSVRSLNVKYVIHVGDVVDEGAPEEWRVANDAFALIDGVVPYTVVPGNHDLDRAASRAGFRTSTSFNAVFSPKRFTGCQWYGGHRGVTADNSFGYFETAGRQFIVLGLEYGPSDETLAWADTLVSNVDDAQVILVTHCYMYDDDTRVGAGDSYNPRGKFGDANDGEGIWDKLVSKNAAISLVLSGHIKGDGTGRLVSERIEGGPVLQMLANYQFLPHGGQGWLRILKFSPKERRLDVHTYSPWLDRTREEPDQRFSIDVPWMFP